MKPIWTLTSLRRTLITAMSSGSSSENGAAGPYIEVRPSKIHGKCAFAVTNIIKGELILVDKPVFSMDAHAPMSAAPILRGLRALPGDQRASLVNLANGRGVKHTRLIPTAEVFNDELGPGSNSLRAIHWLTSVFWDCCFRPDPKSTQYRLFLNAYWLNHSCQPNAEACWREDTKQFEVRAIAEIKEGKEVFISYIDPYSTQKYRTEALQEQGLINGCRCEICTLPEPEARRQDEMRGHVHEAHKALHAFIGKSRDHYQAGDDMSNDKAFEILTKMPKEEWPGLQKDAESATELCSQQNLSLLHRSAVTYHEIGSWLVVLVIKVKGGLSPTEMAQAAETILPGVETLATALGLEHPRTQRILRRYKMFAGGPDSEKMRDLMERLNITANEAGEEDDSAKDAGREANLDDEVEEPANST